MKSSTGKASRIFKRSVRAAILLIVAAAAAWVLSIVFLAQPSPNDPLESPQTRPSTADIARVQITSPLDVRSIDVDKQSWPSEVLSDKIDRQLKTLAVWLSSPETISVDSLRPLVSETITTTGIAPTALKKCFSDEHIRIDRIALEEGEDHERHTDSGIEHLADDLRRMVRPLPNSRAAQVKFKIISIEVDGAAASTQVRVSLHGQSDESHWQQHSLWNCRWTAAADTPMLTRIESLPEAFERVVYRQPRRMYSDHTTELLGSHDCFGDQLRQGINYWLSRLESACGIDLLAAHGISVADVNGDGLDDVYVCQPGGLPNRLFIAALDGTVVEQASAFRLNICDTTRSAMFADLDNDGDQDLALVVANEVIVFEHTESTDFAVQKRITIRDSPTAILGADYDSDGLLDLYVLNHSTRDSDARQHAILGTPVPFHDANNGGANRLLRNLGKFEFADVTIQVGLDVNNRRFSLAGCFEDYDDDGDADIYVANDFGRNNLYRNDNGHFVDVAADLGVEDLSAGMSVSWGDVNNDGLQDLYISNMFSSAGNRIAYQRNFHADQSSGTRSDFQRHARGNSLFIQSDTHRFQDVSRAWNVAMGRWAWASKFADINNDGWLDILISNGFVTNEDTNDL